jgi:two-component system chemotaxis response regulator CheB
MEQRLPIPVVALVCSAGGLDAIARILASLPADLPAAIIALRHTDPAAQNRLPTVLQRHTKLPVAKAIDGHRLEAGHVYTAPAGFHTLVTSDFRTSLIASGERPPYRPSADLLLTSMALAAGTHAIGVILSGHGNDGATGATAIHHHGGLVIASDAATSTVFAMPSATINRDEIIDEILPVDEIASRLIGMVAGMTPAPELSSACAPTCRSE